MTQHKTATLKDPLPTTIKPVSLGSCLSDNVINCILAFISTLGQPSSKKKLQSNAIPQTFFVSNANPIKCDAPWLKCIGICIVGWRILKLVIYNRPSRFLKRKYLKYGVESTKQSLFFIIPAVLQNDLSDVVRFSIKTIPKRTQYIQLNRF